MNTYGNIISVYKDPDTKEIIFVINIEKRNCLPYKLDDPDGPSCILVNLKSEEEKSLESFLSSSIPDSMTYRRRTAE
jgi:hypothetical protein